jgi:hypothetical protein
MSLETFKARGNRSTPDRSELTGMDPFRTKFWKAAALVLTLAMGERLSGDQALDSVDNEADLGEILSKEEQDAVTAGINGPREVTNENVHETAPIQFAATDVNQEAMRMAA